MKWYNITDKIRKALRHFYYEKGMLSFNYYETRDKYIAYINKRYVTWKQDLQYIINYCKQHDIKLETQEDEDTIYIILKP